MNEISLNGKRICLKVSILFKTDTLAKMFVPILPILLSRTIPMSKYFSGSRPLRHNEVQLYLQYSQRGTFIWTPVIAIYLNLFAENDHRDRCYLPIFRVVTGVQLPTTVNTARRGVRTPRIPMAGHGGPLFYTIYMYNVDDEKQLTVMIPRGRPPRILLFGHRDTRGSCPPGSTGVRLRCSTARG